MYSTKQVVVCGVSRTVILRQNQDGTITSFGEYEGNTDYQAYLKWLEEGNTPEPADEVGA